MDDNNIYQIEEKPFKKENLVKKNLVVIIISSVLALIIGFSGGYISAKRLIAEIPEPEQGGVIYQSPTNVTISVDESANSNIEAIAKKASQSVVFVRTSLNNESTKEIVSEGCGIIYSSDGYIVTNYSVIKKVTENAKILIQVFLPLDKDNPIDAELVGYNISYDLAVLKINASGLIPMEIGSSKKLAVGQYAVAVSSPGGIDYMNTVTYGIISGLDRKVENFASGENSISLIQSDAIISSDFDGGALLNIKGQLIGIPSREIVPDNPNGIGFSIPSDKVVEVCGKIIDNEATPEPYIGISFSDSWTPELLKEYGYPEGAFVRSVVKGGPADTAGIKSGDIIVGFDYKPIKSHEELNLLITECQPGKLVVVKYHRSGIDYTTVVTIGSNNAQ